MRDTPVSLMNFRTDPLPSYEDIISGKFPKKSSKDKENSTNNVIYSSKNERNTNNNINSISVAPQFKKISKTDAKSESETEEGELLSEADEIDVKKRKEKINNNNALNNNNNNNNNKNKKVKREPTTQKNNKNNINSSNNSSKSADFTSNITQNTFVPRLVCRYFMEGICSKGEKCTFSHAVVPNKTPEEARVKEPCKFFIMGSCMKGDTCYYSHDLSVVPCKFFHLKGECATVSKGGQCRFSHAPIDKETLEKLRQSESEKHKEKLTAENHPNSNTNTQFIYNSHSANLDHLNTTNEKSQTCKETETSTKCPHEELLNPFAVGSDEDY